MQCSSFFYRITVPAGRNVPQRTCDFISFRDNLFRFFEYQANYARVCPEVAVYEIVRIEANSFTF